MTEVDAVEDSVEQSGALVIGGDYRGLGVARSLGRHGIPVWVLTDKHLIAATSRYTRHHLPWPAVAEDSQIDFLKDLGRQHRLCGWVIFPTGDEAAGLLARHHATLAHHFRLTVPPWDILRWAYDKRLTYRLAAEHGVDCPWTSYPCSREHLAALACSFPAILKPTFKRSDNAFTHAKAWRVESREMLLARYEQARTLVDAEEIMVQELIPGDGEMQFSYAALCVDGTPVAAVTVRRQRQYPRDFGWSSSYVETVNQPDVGERARRLLQAMGFTGLIEVEFKRDPRDGRLKLLDVNPRVWGWHTIARRAGLDFPYLHWKLLHGETVPGACARPGLRWVRAATDVPAVVSLMMHGELSPRAYVRSLRGHLECATFAPDDPVPAVLDVPLLAYRRWQR